MKDSQFIVLKLIKKHVVPIVLLLMGLMLICINLASNNAAYAKEQVALVTKDVFVVDNGCYNNILTKSELLSGDEQAVLNFGDISAKLNSNSHVEIVYQVENLKDTSSEFKFNLNKVNIKNFNITYSLNNEFCGDLTGFSYTARANETFEIKVTIAIDNVCLDANLNGFIDLTYNKVG